LPQTERDAVTARQALSRAERRPPVVGDAPGGLIEMEWFALYLLVGAGIGVCDFAFAKPPLDPPLRGSAVVGFVSVMLLWPLALIPWERMGLD
jgi:hypothetical protein